MPQTIMTQTDDSAMSEVHVAAPPERVFKALTDSSELALWFTNPSCPVKVWEMDARPGGRYRYQTKKGELVVNQVDEFECHGEILEFDAPRLLVYSWIANWHDDKAQRTIVRWELTPKSGGTQVKVTHSGLRNIPVARQDYSGGWIGVLAGLKAFVEK